MARREARLKAALRANLRRRKAQASDMAQPPAVAGRPDSTRGARDAQGACRDDPGGRVRDRQADAGETEYVQGRDGLGRDALGRDGGS